MDNKTNIVNGTVTGVHLGSPMQDSCPDKASDNEAYYVERETVSNAVNYENQLEYVAPKESGGGVQGDWTQNDSTAPDYIKNRPFYREEVTEYTDITTFTYTSSGMLVAALSFPYNDIELHTDDTVISLSFNQVGEYIIWSNDEAGCKFEMSVTNSSADVELPESMIGKEITIKGKKTTTDFHSIDSTYLPTNVVYTNTIRPLLGLQNPKSTDSSVVEAPYHIYLRPTGVDPKGYDYYELCIINGELFLSGYTID